MSGKFTELSSFGAPRTPFRIAPAVVILDLFPLKMSFQFNAALNLLGRQEVPAMIDLYPADGAQVGDVGVQIVVQVLDQDDNVVDIAGASALKIKFLKPDGTALDKTAVLYSDGTDGKIVYTTLTGDLDQAGLYQLQGKLNLNSTPKSTRLGALVVAANVDNA